MLCLSLICAVDSRLQETALVLEMELRDWAGKPGRIWVCIGIEGLCKSKVVVVGSVSKNYPKDFRFFAMVYIEGCMERYACICVCVL